MSDKEAKRRKYVLVTPDGGWGYMVGLGVIINLGALLGFSNCFGMLYKDLFIEINMDTTSVTLTTGVGCFSVALSGFLVGPLQKYFSLRQVGIVGALMYNLGAFCTVFVNSKLLFILSQGMIQGFGNGIMYNVSCTMLNNYFVKRRLLAFSLSHSTTAFFCLLSPQLVKWSIEKYGSQGTLLLVSGIYMHNIFGMALMQPVAWHMKKVEVHEHEEKEMELLMADAKELEANKNNLTYLNKSDILEHDIDEKHDSQIKIFVSRFIDFSLFKSYVLSNACVGVALCGCMDLLFIMMLPQALYSMGWDESEVATALSLNALVDLGTRILMILMNNVFMKIGSHETYLAGLVIAFISRIGMLWFESHTAILTFISIIGVSRCTIALLTPVVVADSVGQEKFTSALSMMVCIFGLSNCTVAPLIGAIRDLTNSYSAAFYVLTSCFGIVVISWSIELIYKKTIRNRIPKMDASLKS